MSEIRVDNVKNEAGTGAPTFPNGAIIVGNVGSTSLNITGISTLGNTVVGGGTTQLIVTGDARITGILTIGTSSITLDGSNNQVNVGTGVTLHHTNGVQVGGNNLHSTVLTVNQINASGVITATSFSGALTGNATGLSGTPNITVGNIIASSATISGNVSVAGTVTYEDVTNVDSIGIITARTGIVVTAGGINASGVITATSFSGSGANLTGIAATTNVVTNSLVVSGITTVAAGSAAAPSITPTGDSNTGIFFPAADTIAFGEGGSEAARIDSSGRFGIGTLNPARKLAVSTAGTCNVRVSDSTNGVDLEVIADSTGGAVGTVTNHTLRFLTNDTERGRFDTSGRLLVGASSLPLSSSTSLAHVYGNTQSSLRLWGTNQSALILQRPGDIWSANEYNDILWQGTAGGGTDRPFGRIRVQVTSASGSGSPTFMSFYTNGDAANDTERMRIDPGGRLLLGTSTATGNHKLQILGDSSTTDAPAGIRLARGRTPAQINNTIELGRVEYTDSSGNVGAQIIGHADETWGTNDYPSRLVFSITADGASSPTERMRIKNNGQINIGHDTSNSESHFLSVVQTSNTDNTTPTVKIRRQEAAGGGTSSMTTALDVRIPNTINNNSATAIYAYAGLGLENTAYAIDAAVVKSNNGVTRAARFTGGQGNTDGYGTQAVVQINAEVSSGSGIGHHGKVIGQLIYLPNYDPLAHGGATGRNIGIRIENATAGSNQYDMLSFVRNGIEVGTIKTNNTTTFYNTTSDYRLKENVVNLDNAAERLKQIPVRRFNFIDNPDAVVDGFLAHEVAPFVPEAVTGTKDETRQAERVDENQQPILDADGNSIFDTEPVYQTIDQSKLVPLLTAALQEAIGEIESLKARVAALESA